MLYKTLADDGSARHGGTGSWPLPIKSGDGTWTPGDWLDIRDSGKMVACTATALHLCRDEQIISWFGPALYEAEADGLEDAGDKCITQRARLLRRIEAWDERTQRLLACDCAEHVLPLWEARFPNDKRPREAIAVARRFARGEATLEELQAAWAAACDTAWAATWAAARAAAGDAEHRWQYERFLDYMEGRLV